MSYPYLGPYAARIRVVGFGSANSPQGLTPGQEYALFELNVTHSKTAGTGACPGCDQPVEIAFRSVRLVQGGGCGEPGAAVSTLSAPPDVILDRQATSNRAYWQAVFTDVGPGQLAAGLSLARAGSNPADGELAVDFILPTSAPARLELFDVSGRHLASHEVGLLGPGSHRFVLARRDELRPGLYFVRLRQRGESRYLKASLVR
jgi:hypothetical protein